MWEAGSRCPRSLASTDAAGLHIPAPSVTMREVPWRLRLSMIGKKWTSSSPRDTVFQVGEIIAMLVGLLYVSLAPGMLLFSRHRDYLITHPVLITFWHPNNACSSSHEVMVINLGCGSANTGSESCLVSSNMRSTAIVGWHRFMQ